MAEFKKRAFEKMHGTKQKNTETAAVYHELGDDIDELRQIFNDQDVGSVGIQSGQYNEINGGDADAGWFNLDHAREKDFYKDFLNNVKCSAYTTACTSPLNGSAVKDDLTCGETGKKKLQCVTDLNCSGNEEQLREEAPIAQRETVDENYYLQEMDLEDELREMEDYRYQQDQMNQSNPDPFLGEHMERQGSEVEEIRDERGPQKDKGNQTIVKSLKQFNANKEEKEEEEQAEQKGTPVSNDKGNWFGNVLGRLIEGDFSALEDFKSAATKKLSENLNCGEDIDLLDYFRCRDDPEQFVPVGVQEERRTLYGDSNGIDCPPTALYAAIGTKSWNIALRRLLEEPIEASVWVKNASTDGETLFRFLPLHIACLSGAPLLLVTLLVQAYPNAVKYNAMGKLPIHMACETLTDHRIVFLLINAWSESINATDEEGFTPIELVSLKEPCDERKMIVKVLTRKLECTVVKTPTTLYSFIDSQDWNSAIMTLVEIPQEATTWVSFTKKRMEVRFLPLHIACLLGAPYFLISDLVHAYPDAVRKKTTQGQLPLHIACEAHGDERIVELLVESWPESLFVMDDSGKTALEIASGTEYSPEKTCILAVLQKKLEHKDKIVFSPTTLFSIIELRNWDVAVSRCFEAPDEVSTWVGSCQKLLDAKLLPIHIACSLNAPLILIAVLIQSFPDGVKRTNNSGKLPIHLACEKRADHRIVSLLLHTWPESVHELDERGNTPVQVTLLSIPSPERTKIVETLMAFESNSDKETLVVTNEMFDVENEAKELVKQHQPRRNDETNIKTQRGRSRKPRRKNKSLWKDDAEMFANE
jgi:ankyrin repeat protein